jgi:lysozyme family protein
MTTANFDAWLTGDFSAEGGYVDDPLDHGGANNLGITLDTLGQWRHTAATKEDVRNLTREEAGALECRARQRPAGRRRPDGARRRRKPWGRSNR